MPFAASAAPFSCTPPSVGALKPALCIALKSVEENRKMPRVSELGAGVGEGLELGDGFGRGDAAPVSRGRMSPTPALAEAPSSPTPYASSRPRSVPYSLPPIAAVPCADPTTSVSTCSLVVPSSHVMMIRLPAVHQLEASTWPTRPLRKLSPSAGVPSCMSFSRFGVTQMNEGAVPELRSLVSCVYGTTRLHWLELLRTVS